MLTRIIRIAATLAGILLLAGCSVRLDPAQEGIPISFSAGNQLLRDDAKPTKTGTPKDGTQFELNDAFLAWAWHSAARQHLSFGTTDPVTLQGNGLWEYAPHQFWDWRESDDYYDFLALYPADRSADFTHPAATLENPNLRASVQYDATDDQYDLMAAGYRRNDKTISAVPLNFSHRLSAVSVEVSNADGSVNNVGDPLTITLVSCQFANLITSAAISITFNGVNLEVTTPGDRSANPVLGPVIPADTELAPGYGFPSIRIINRLVTWLGSHTSLTAEAKQDLAAKIYEDEVWDMTDGEIAAWLEAWEFNSTSLTFQQITALAGQIIREDEWDLMIPQNLAPLEELDPTLRIVYNAGDDDIVQSLPLKEIRNQVNGNPITEWRAGIQYHYRIELRIGVGIIATVETTPWDVVEAETPGLMI